MRPRGGNSRFVKPFLAVSDPAVNEASDTSIIDYYGGVLVTLTGPGNAQTLGSPSNPVAGRQFVFLNDDTSTDNIVIDGYTVEPGDGIKFVWDGTAWLPVGSGSGGGGGISADSHRILRQLIHFIDEGPAGGFTSGAYKETLPTGNPFPTSVIWWESSSKLKKIVERAIIWTGVKVTTDTWKVYDTDGSTVLAQVSDSISYSGVFETTRTRTIVVY